MYKSAKMVASMYNRLFPVHFETDRWMLRTGVHTYERQFVHIAAQDNTAPLRWRCVKSDNTFPTCFNLSVVFCSDTRCGTVFTLDRWNSLLKKNRLAKVTKLLIISCNLSRIMSSLILIIYFPLSTSVSRTCFCMET